MISVHWIPTHRGQEDKERFAHWKPPFVKIVCVDEKPPYTEDIPASSTIIIRNHPLSELYGARGFAAVSATDGEDITAKYEAYFAAFFQQAGAAPSTRYRDGFSPTSSRAGAAALATPEQVGTEHAAACQRMAQYCESKGVARSRLLFEGLNEPQLWANEPPALVARYYKSFLSGLHGYNLHGVVGNFGVGWPGNGGVNDAPPEWDFFKPVIDIFQTGDYLGLHEYWALSGPQQNWKWWGGRFLQCPYKVPILITECGIDTGVTGNWYGGWYDLPGSMDQKAVRYVDEIYWYARQGTADGRIKGIFPFTYDIGGKEWEKFDIRNEGWINTFFKKLDAEGMPQPGTMPTPPTPTPTPTPTPGPSAAVIQAIRNAAWNQLGIPYNPEAAFAKYARAQKLGNPVTTEFDISGYRAQGFAGGIVYAKIGDWANIQLLAW
jgi:hypothetical protein